MTQTVWINLRKESSPPQPLTRGTAEAQAST